MESVLLETVLGEDTLYLFLKLQNRFLTESYTTAWIAFEEIVSKTFSKTFYYNDVRRPM